VNKNKKQNPKPLLFHLGNLLIIISALSFFVFFYPVISAYVFPPEIKKETELKGNFISVPKIRAQAPLFFDVDPFNESEYKPVLRNGVAHAKGTKHPGEKGSVFVFAHSSGNPIEITNYNTIFLRLNELEKGDEITITKNGKNYKYKVTEKKIVWPGEVKYLEEKKNQLILQTCWPIGTDLKRLLVFAAPSN
jgi:LPXTG-site transpeptidase (sortase) family protein